MEAKPIKMSVSIHHCLKPLVVFILHSLGSEMSQHITGSPGLLFTVGEKSFDLFGGRAGARGMGTWLSSGLRIVSVFFQHSGIGAGLWEISLYWFDAPKMYNS